MEVGASYQVVGAAVAAAVAVVAARGHLPSREAERAGLQRAVAATVVVVGVLAAPAVQAWSARGFVCRASS